MSNLADLSDQTKVDQDLVVLRHHEVASAIAKHPPAVVSKFLRESAKLRERAAQRFWSGQGSKNRAVLGKCGLSDDDIRQHCMVWAVGYLTHAKPASDGSFAVDGRLDSYLRQRFAELISKFGRRARSCSPATSSAGRADDLADASMSKPAASEAEMVEWLDSRNAAPRSSRGAMPAYRIAKARPALIERLAAIPHRDAIEKLEAVLPEEVEDGRSQTARYVKAMRECRGDCLVCAARRRESSWPILDLPRGVQLPQVRQLVEAHLDLITATIPRRSASSVLRAAVALGLMAKSSDGTMSATRWGFALTETARGSLAERVLFSRLIRSSKSIQLAPTTKRCVFRMSQEERRQALAWMEDEWLSDSSRWPTTRLSELTDHYLTTGRGAPSGWVEYCRAEPDAPEKLCIVKDLYLKEIGGEMTTTTKNERFTTKAVRVEQNDRTFYLAAIPVEVLFGCCFIDRHEDNEKGYQRKLEEPRAEKIAAYLAVPGHSIPGNIVLSATSEADVTFDEQSGELSFLRCKGAFACMDGQHRLWGYKKRGGLIVPTTIYVELDSISEARMFIDVNEEQKGVPKALLLQIKSLANMESEREKELRVLFDRFQKDERSPIRDMLHTSGRKQGLINRASFDYAVGRAQRSDSFGQLPEAKRFGVLLEYVRAFSEALEDKTKLGRRYYFAAMFDAFDEVLRWTKSKSGNIAKASLAASIKKIANVSGGTQTALAAAMRAGLNDVSLSDDDSAEY